MNSLNKQLTTLISLLFITACNGQSNLDQSEKKILKRWYIRV